MTPPPVDVTAPPVAVAVSTFTPVPEPGPEGPRSVATGIVPTESATGIASAIPTVAPSPTEVALAALVVKPTLVPAPTDVPATAVILPPTDIAQHPFGTTVPPVAVAPPFADAPAAEQYAIDLINAQRAAAGVPPLNRDETLMTIARARVADMVARGYTGHNDPVTGERLGRAMMRAASSVLSVDKL